ncbi:MAG: glycosyltransferase [Bacteroidetes bacterium]|nr:glycosyltransferase [Bacteroidota bacterium]
MNFKKVCVILPCFNESLTLPTVVGHIQKISSDIEILVVDNSSTDDSFNTASKLGVKVVREIKRGKGFAVKRGFLSLSDNCEIVVIVDSDDTYSLTNLITAINLVKDYNYDMIVGNRINEADSNGNRINVFRRGHRTGNLIFSKLSQLLHPSGVLDSLSGFRVMSRNFVESFTGGASEFEIEAELNAHAAFIKAAVGNIDVKYKGRPIGSESKLRTYRDGYKILLINFKIFRTYRPKIAYSLLALFWIVLSLSLGYKPITEYFDTGLVPRIPSLIAAVGALVVSIQLWNTGMILERVNVAHVSQVRNNYKLGYKNKN